MKHTIRLVSALLLLLMLGALLSFSAAATPAAELTTVYDYANVFSSEEEAELNLLAEGYQSKLVEGNILIVITDDFRSNAEAEAEKLGFSSRSDSCFLLVVFVDDNRIYEYETYTLGDMSRYISGSRYSAIDLDSMLYNRIKMSNKNDLYLACERFIYLAGEEMLLVPGRQTARIFIILGVSLLIGLAAGGIAVFLVWKKYNKKNRSASYPLQDFTRLNLTVQRDAFLGKTVVHTRISTNSGGGRSGRGGFSRGGGGGRSGGRH